MGLIKNNYYVKGTKQTLSTAYAIVKDLKVKGDYCEATFVVQQSRDYAFTADAIETIKINFKVDRNESPFVTAYKEATSQYEDIVINEETGHYEKVIKNQPFFDWTNDIQII